MMMNQTLESRIADLEAENGDLQAEVDDLRQRVETLQDQIKDLEADKIAAELVVQELTDAMTDIYSTAGQALR